jgi:hypothetical protein
MYESMNEQQFFLGSGDMIEEFDNTKFARASRKISKTPIGNPSSDIVDYTKQKHHKKKLNFSSYLTEQVEEKVRKLSIFALWQWKGVEQNCGAPPAVGLEIAFCPKKHHGNHQLSDPFRAATCSRWIIIKLFTKMSL